MRTRSRFYHCIAVAASATDTVGGMASAMVWKTTLPPCPVFEYVLSFEIVFLSFKYFMVFHCCFVNQRKASILTILFSLHWYHRAAYGTRVWLSTLFLLTHVIHSCNQSVSQSFIYGMSYRTEWSLFTFNANVFALLFVYLLIWLPFGEYFSFFGVKHDTSIPCQLTHYFKRWAMI